MPSLADLMALHPAHFALTGSVAMLRHTQACPVDLHFPDPLLLGCGVPVSLPFCWVSAFL